MESSEEEPLKKTRIIFLGIWYLIFLFSCTGEDQKEQIFIWQNLERGAYSVGYKVEHVYDYSRTFKAKYDYEGKLINEETARPIQITIWYPAAQSRNEKQMSYGEYFRNEATEIDFSRNTIEARALIHASRRMRASRSLIRENRMKKAKVTFMSVFEMKTEHGAMHQFR